MLPLMIDCTHKKIIIIGGGSVAARKAAYFSNADVVMYSRTFHPDVPTYVTCISCTLKNDHNAIRRIIEGAFFVIAATSDPILNTLIIDICSNAHILCNNADGKAGDVIIPAQIQRGDIVISISSGGSSPALAQFLRIHLEEMFPELEQIAAFLTILKSELKHSIDDQKVRSLIIHNALKDQKLLEQVSNFRKRDEDLNALATQYIKDYQMAGFE